MPQQQRPEKHGGGPGRPRDDELAIRRRREIVRHAIDEFASKGFAGADLDVIAANAGCSKGTLYHYFVSKGALFSASVDHVMFSVVEAIEPKRDSDPVELLEDLVLRFLRHFAAHPQHVELLVQERSDFKDREEPTYYRYREASRAEWQRRLVDRALNGLSDLLYGTIFMNYFRRRQVSPERQAADLLDVLLGGLLTEKELARFQARKS
jgi:AcrR family transcriptional regulator